jgi:AcrR family transcriptional regulator
MPNPRAANSVVAAARDAVAPDSDVGSAESARPEVREDGRHARRDRNKYAVVDAYLELVREGNPRPSVAEVADRSGVSHRSVFRYFADKDELARTAIERQVAFAMPMVPLTVKPDAPLDERIEKFVARRLQLWEALGPVARLARAMAAAQPLIDAELTETRTFFRAQVRHLFRPEIDAVPAAERSHLLAALDVMSSFEVSDLLRRDHGLSVDDTAATWRWSLTKLLAG